MNVGFAEIWAFLRDAGLAGLLIFILWGGSRPKPWWVFGREYERLQTENDELYDRLMTVLGITQRTVDRAGRAVDTATRKITPPRRGRNVSDGGPDDGG